MLSPAQYHLQQSKNVTNFHRFQLLIDFSVYTKMKKRSFKFSSSFGKHFSHLSGRFPTFLSQCHSILHALKLVSAPDDFRERS